MPAVVWDNQRFATDEGKICFHNANCITDDMMKVIKRAVKANDRNVLKHDMKMVNVLRVNDSKMAELDEGLKKYKKLVSLSLCGNFISDINSDFIPPSVKTLELQANCLKDVSGFAETLPSELLYLGLARNFLTSSNNDILYFFILQQIITFVIYFIAFFPRFRRWIEAVTIQFDGSGSVG